MDFVDRLLTCSDCGEQFIFTAGEQLFFFDKQFKNDPKRCKPCKGKRGSTTARSGVAPSLAAGVTRTETRTECSACGVGTTVPFKPTQGRPVLCRQCFQRRQAPSPAAVAAQGELAQMKTATAELVAAAAAGSCDPACSSADMLSALPSASA